jgi:hypothetical protein
MAVDAGRIRLEGPTQTLPSARAAVRNHLELPAVPEEGFDLVPFDRVDEVLLQEGDRVSIHGDLEREPLPSSQSAYRHARWLYRPSGVVGLRIEPTDQTISPPQSASANRR